jgi:hypothetical protein
VKGSIPTAPQDPFRDPPPYENAGIGSSTGYAAPAASSLRRSDTTGSMQISESDKFRYLQRYNTMFVIDDSGDSRPQWSTIRTLVEECAEISAKHDRDGVDVQFLNVDRRFENLTSRAAVMRAFDSVRVDSKNPSFIGHRVDKILTDFKTEFKEAQKHGKQTEMRGLNIVVFTTKVDPDIDDIDIQIENHGQDLGKLGAENNKVGISFVQIGSDGTTKEFLQHMDDNLKDKVGRDMVDTFQIKDGEPITVNRLFKILVGGINRKADANENV